MALLATLLAALLGGAARSTFSVGWRRDGGPTMASAHPNTACAHLLKREDGDGDDNRIDLELGELVGIGEAWAGGSAGRQRQEEDSERERRNSERAEKAEEGARERESRGGGGGPTLGRRLESSEARESRGGGGGRRLGRRLGSSEARHRRGIVGAGVGVHDVAARDPPACEELAERAEAEHLPYEGGCMPC
eukprot:5534255-Prymnesium_polylepis.1